MINFAKFVPDWNSLDIVRRTHSDLELAAIIFFAILVVCDLLAHFTEKKDRERIFEKIGLCFFAVAVICEAVAYKYGQRNDELSEQVIGSLDIKANDAARKAGKAATDSGTAITQAGEAEVKSGNAVTSASAALTIASGARSEADTFGNDIKFAKEQAADANIRLAQALKEVAEAENELERIRTPRSIPDPSSLSALMHDFNGTTYTFLGVYADKESINLTKQIDGILSAAGWKRVKPPNSNPIILTISSDFTVAPSAESGLLVQVEAPNPLSLLNAPESLLPMHIRAAIALKKGLASGVVPPQEDLRQQLSVSPGNHTDVFITVGRKP